MPAKKKTKSAEVRGGAAKAAKGGKGTARGKGAGSGKGTRGKGTGGKGTGGKGTGGGKGTQPPKMRTTAAPGPQFGSTVPPFDRTRVASDVEGMAIFIDLSGDDRSDLLQAIEDFADFLSSENSIIVMYKGPRPKIEE